jgi:hypoxanthine phosphoribosyltransferase
MADFEGSRSFDFGCGISRSYVSYGEVLSMSRKVGGRACPNNYDFVIGVANGGLAIAQIVFDEIREGNKALGVGSVQMRRYRGTICEEPEFLYFPRETLAGKRLLVCDELVDEGETLLALSRELASIGSHADYLALYQKDGASFTPEYLGRKIPRTVEYEGRKFQNWLVFPWEREWLSR